MTVRRIIDRLAWWLDAPRDGKPAPDLITGVDWFATREHRWRCQTCDVLWWGAGRDCWVCGRNGVVESN